MIDNIKGCRADKYAVARRAMKIAMSLDSTIILPGRVFEDDTDPIAGSEESSSSELDSA